MRTLVIGIPVPHVTFDNYSFISAPSFADYSRVIVEMAAVSQVVEEVAAGSAQHKTYADQPVADAPTSLEAFGLADLLATRRREAERFLASSGVVCFAHLDAPHPCLQTQPRWRRYSWLPSPPGFLFEAHLLPSFGKPGWVNLEDAVHPFAPYIETLASRLAYRAYIDEEAPGFEG